MLYQKLLLDLPDIDDIRTKFSSYWLKSLTSIADSDSNIKKDIFSNKFEMEDLMGEFGIFFGPLGSSPGNRSIIDLYLNEMVSSFMVLASRGFDQFVNLSDEVKFRCELADVVLILSLTKDNVQWQEVLQKEFEIVLDKYVSILPKQPSIKAKELLLKTVRNVGNSFSGYINSNDELLKKSKDRIETIRKEIRKIQTQLSGSESATELLSADLIHLRDYVMYELDYWPNSKIEINPNSNHLQYQENPDEKFANFLSYLSAQKLNQEQIDDLMSKLYVLNEDLDQEIVLNEKGVPAYVLLQDRLNKESVENYIPEVCEMFFDHIALVKYEYLDKQNLYKEYTDQDYPLSLRDYIIAELHQTASQSEDYKIDNTLWESYWYALSIYFSLSLLEIKKITENTKEELLKSERKLLGNDEFCRKSYKMEFYQNATPMRLLVEFSIAQKLKSVQNMSFGEFICSMEKIEIELNIESKLHYSSLLDEIYEKYLPIYMDRSSADKKDITDALNIELGQILSSIFKYDLKIIVENLYDTLINIANPTKETEENDEEDYIEEETRSRYDIFKLLIYRNKIESNEATKEQRINYT